MVFDKFREYGLVIEGSSTWSAPSFAIKKKNGECRIVTNFRYLNSQLVHVMFPLPLISDLKMVVANKTIFSKFDVVKAFYSIGVREKDWHLLCTGTSFGSFLYTVVPMGLTTSPSVMTRCMNKFPIMNFSNISLIQNKILCILVFCISVYFL